MSKFIPSVFAACLFAVTGAAVSSPVHAEEEAVVVSYDDLDLTSPAGAAVLERRLEAAADRVCVKPRLLDLKAMTAWEECRATTLADAKEQLSVTEPFERLALASLF